MKVIIETPGTGFSSNAEERRSKAWLKVLDSVDREISNGYAFVGRFIQFDATAELEAGTHLMSYRAPTGGQGRVYRHLVTLYRVDPDGLTEVQEWDLGDGKGWALRVRDEIADLIEKPDLDALKRRRDELRKELDAIEQQIAAHGA